MTRRRGAHPHGRATVSRGKRIKIALQAIDSPPEDLTLDVTWLNTTGQHARPMLRCGLFPRRRRHVPAAPRVGTQTHDIAERTTIMRLVGKTTGKSDLGQRFL